MRQTLLIVFLAFIACAILAEAKPSKTMPMTMLKKITGNEPLPESQTIPYNPGTITDSPGTIVGYTYYDYQTNGSTGNRVALCNDNSVYFCWTKAFGWPYPPATRHVYYNWIDPEGEWLEPEQGYQVSVNSGSGYTNLDIRTDNRGVIAYHQGDFIIVSVERLPGFEIFDHYTVPNQLFPQDDDSPGICMWPYIAVDRNNRIHLAMTEATDTRLSRMAYTRSNDGGPTWTTPQQVDTVMVISSVIDASPVSDRVVLAYSKTTDTTTQWYNDIVYYVSQNGTTWDWRYGRHNITDYAHDNDSLWAYTDLDVIFDYNDFIHVIWNAQWVTDAGIYYRTFLLHYDEETDQIDTIAAMPDSLWSDISGNWNRPICKMNLGVQQLGNVICATWTQFDTSDVSAGGYGNGDLYMSFNENDTIWHDPENMTNSRTPGCFPGECDNDHWSTLADVVKENTLRVFFVNDKDAGGIPQTEGAATESPLRFLLFTYTGIKDNANNLPLNFSLSQNSPNPFNADTKISFSLRENASVTLEVFDITGAKVSTLVDAVMPIGNHDVIWDASDVASGIYYYRLTMGEQSQTKQAVLIK